MSSFAFIDGRVEINAVDLSDFVRSVQANITVDELDDTAMGDTWRSRIGGLKDGQVALEFNSDFAASAVDVTLWPILGTVVTVKLRPTSAAISATNPEYSGPVLISKLSPIANGVGDLGTVSVTWPTAGTFARATA